MITIYDNALPQEPPVCIIGGFALKLLLLLLLLLLLYLEIFKAVDVEEYNGSISTCHPT